MEHPRPVDISGNGEESDLYSIDDTRFAVDGVIAEMIIEVHDDPADEQTPNKAIMEIKDDVKPNLMVTKTSPDELSKQLFAHNLGLSSAAADKPDTLTVSGSGTLARSGPGTLTRSGSDNLTRSRSKTFTANESDTFTLSESELQTMIDHSSETPVKPPTEKKKPWSKYRNLRLAAQKRQTTRMLSKNAKELNVSSLPISQEVNASNLPSPQPAVVLRKLAMPTDNGIPSSSSSSVRLANIPKVCERIKKSKWDVLEALFQLMYGETPIFSKDVDLIKYQVLQFAGFSFPQNMNKSSKVMQSLTKYEDAMLRNICHVFGIKLGPKDDMVKNILSYLNQPTIKLDPSVDIAYQPVVVLLYLDANGVAKICEELQTSFKSTKYKRKKSNIIQTKTTRSKAVISQQTSKKKPPVANVRSLRKNKDIAKPVVPLKNIKPKKYGVAKSVQPVLKVDVKPKVEPKVDIKKKAEPIIEVKKKVEPNIEVKKKVEPKVDSKKLKILPSRKGTKTVDPTGSSKKALEATPPSSSISKRKQKWPQKALVESQPKDQKKETGKKTQPDVPAVGVKRPSSGMERRKPEKRRKPSHYGEWLNEESRVKTPVSSPIKPPVIKKVVKKAPEVIEIEREPIEEPTVDEESENNTLSNEEEYEENEETDELSDPEHMEIDVSDSEESPKDEKTKSKGVRLGTFPQIVSSINSITNCVLQRLHVILFGTSFEPELMKRNILNFSGFPFDKASEDWEQKHFFLSLSASNNLLEVFEVLHVKTSSDCSTALVDDLMNFLLCPQKELLDDDSFGKSPKKKSPPKIRIEIGKSPEKKNKEYRIIHEPRARKQLNTRNVNIISHQQKQKSPDKDSSIEDTSSESDDLVTPSCSSEKLKLGENSHVKFMVVALNYVDLDVLHHLLFLHGTGRSKVRRDILEFSGFDFTASSMRYKVRKTILMRLGIKMVKRVAFILGLTPLETSHKIEVLIDKIMRFLMHPNESHQIKVKEFPYNFIECPIKVFDKKTVFANIRQLPEVIMQESGRDVSTPGGLIVKNISDLKMKNDCTSSPGKAMVLPRQAIPVAEVVPVNEEESSVSSAIADTREKLQMALMSAKKKNIILKRAEAGGTVCFVPSVSESAGQVQTEPGPSRRLAQPSTKAAVSSRILLPGQPSTKAAVSPRVLVPAQKSLQARVSSHAIVPTQTSQSTASSRVIVPAKTSIEATVATNSTTQKPNSVPILINQSKLPAGQTFLLDPSKLLVLSKSTHKSPPSISSSRNLPASETTSKDTSSVKAPILTKLKLPVNSTQSESPAKQVPNIIRPVISQPLPSSQPPQAIILHQGGSRKALLLQPGVSLQNSSSPPNSTQTFAIMKPPQSQQQSLFLLPAPLGQPLTHLTHILPRPSPITVTSELQDGKTSEALVSFPTPSTINISQSPRVASSVYPTSISMQNVPPSISELPQLIQGEPSSSTTTESSHTIDLSKLLRLQPQKVDALKPIAAEEGQKKLNGEGERITLLKAPLGHPLPTLELGILNSSPVQSSDTTLTSVRPQSVPTVLSLKPSKITDNTTLCESGYKVPLSTGFTPQGTLLESEAHSSAQDQHQSVEDPSDDLLFERIRDIIHAANLEDLTLKKINEKLMMEFPQLDLSVRRPFIKSTVKNIICGMPP